MEDKFELKVWNIGGRWNCDDLCKKYEPYLGKKTNAFSIDGKEGIICRYYTCYGGENGQFAIEYEHHNRTTWVNAEKVASAVSL